MKPKIYLEPRDKFDTCIVRESPECVTYSVQKIINMLGNEYKEESSTLGDDYFFMALEYYEYNIEPLQHLYNIEFDEIYDYE